MYIVKYSQGSYDSFREVDVFVTDKKSTATKYVTKFNEMHKKWRQYYRKFEDNKTGFSWIKDEYVEKHFDRWHQIKEINDCYWEEIVKR